MTRDEALRLVRDRGVVTVTDTEDAGESFVFAVTGEHVRGSWWGHARGREIWNLSNAVVDSGEAIALKLVAGKETFLHRRLWPALARVVTDPGFRDGRTRHLSAGARALLEAVEAAGTLRLDEYAKSLETKRDADAARRELAKALLVRADDLHTERGSHTTVLESWSAWVARERLDLEGLSLEGALEAIRAACGSAPLAIDPPRPRRR